MESSRDSIVLHEDSQDGPRPDPNQPTPRDTNAKSSRLAEMSQLKSTEKLPSHRLGEKSQSSNLIRSQRSQKAVSDLSRRTPNSHLSRKSGQASSAANKYKIDDEEYDRLNRGREIAEKAKDFKRANKTICVVRQSTQMPTGGNPGTFVPNELDQFLQGIQTIVDADITHKHQVQIDTCDKIIKMVKNPEQGECCRDFLKYLSNLKKNFTETSGALANLTEGSSKQYEEIELTLKNNRITIGDEQSKNVILTTESQQQAKEIKKLRSQLEDLLSVVDTAKDQKDAATENGTTRQQVIQRSKNEVEQEVAASQERKQNIDDLASRLTNDLRASVGSTDSQNAAMSTFDKLKSNLDTLLEENHKFMSDRNNAEFKLALSYQNTTILEDKLSSIITTHEEESIQLKSQVVIYKQKTKEYKTKLHKELDQFKARSLEREKEGIYKEKIELENQIVTQEQNSKVQKKLIEELTENVADYRKRYNKLDSKYEDRLTEKEMNVQTLTDQIAGMKESNQTEKQDQQLAGRNQKMTVKLEEKDKTMNTLKLQFMQNNQKKLMAQKVFIEKQLKKDSAGLLQQMNRIELEIKKDEVIKTVHAVHRMKSLTKAMTDSYRYINQVVSFMVFDSESNIEEFDETQIERQAESQGLSQAQADNASSGGEKENSQQDKPAIPAPETLGSARGTGSTGPQQSNRDGARPMQRYDPELVSVEKLIRNNPHDLTAMLLSVIEEQYQVAKTPLSSDFTSLQAILKSKIVPQFQDQLQKQFLQQPRIHYSQHIFKISHKVKSLEQERNQLNKELAKYQKKFDDLEQEQKSRLEPAKSPRSASQGNTPRNKKLSRQMSGDPDEYDPDSPTNIIDRMSGRQSGISEFVQESSRQKEENESVVGILKRENDALRMRIKEIRLVLNKQVNELKETLNVARTSYDAEITRSKIQYGKDLSKLSRKFERDMERQKLRMEDQQDSAIKETDSGWKREILELRVHKDKQIADVDYKRDEFKHEVKRLSSEVKKLRSESSDLYKGGWGTFSLAFENPAFLEMQQKVNELEGRKQQYDVYKQGLKKKRSKQQKLQIANFESEIEAMESEVNTIRAGMDTIVIHPIEKLCHFIEVGFQIGALNFLHLYTYNEQTFDSMLRKYVFEFQQLMNQTEFSLMINKIREQISENFALFNEINPIYITLNLGRPANAFKADGENCKPIEDFTLIDRKVTVVTGRLLAINFLKCDEPLTFIRVVAYSNNKGQTYSLDLNKEDLLTLVEGNQKLIEEENMADLCQLIANSLSLIQRKINVNEFRKKDMNEFDELLNEEVLAVEHRLFFNELCRSNWDQKNKMLKAKHDKHLQGLIKDCSVSTDFDKAIVYEAFNEVYTEHFALNLVGGPSTDQADHFTLILERGAMSGHFKLRVQLDYTTLEQTLYLLESNQQQVKGESHEITSAIVKAPQEGCEALAYVISMEKVFGRDDVVVIKVVSVQRRFAEDMSQFNWDPQKGTVVGSTTSTQEIFYLVKKLGFPVAYNRVKDFEILNTDIRTQLFKHSFGYNQQAVDFGNVGLLCEKAEKPAVQVSNEAGDLQREIATVRTESDQHLAQPVELENTAKLDIHIIRQFCIIRVQLLPLQVLNLREDLDSSVDEVKNSNFESHFASVTLTTKPDLLEKGIIIVNVIIPEIKDAEITTHVLVTDLVQLSDLPEITAGRKDEFCSLLLERLIATKSSKGFQSVYFDQDIDGMTEVMRTFRQEKFDKLMCQSSFENIELEVPDSTILGVSQFDLQNCPKSHQSTTLISHRAFKFTCYFLQGIKNFRPKANKLFDWQCIYLEVYEGSKDRKFIQVLTEHDLISIVDTIKQTMEMENENEEASNPFILSEQMPQANLVRLAKDLLHFDTKDDCIKISLETLRMRIQERSQLEELFVETGGQYVFRVGDQDPELANFQTCVPRVEYNKKLIVNEQKDFSQSQVNIEIFECFLDSMPGQSMLQIDIHDIDERTLIYRTNVYCPKNKVGKGIHMERLNFKQYIQNNNKVLAQTQKAMSQSMDDAEEDAENEFHELCRKSYVLTISESSLPHEFSFTLLEPASHIFWNHTYRNENLNQIESRANRQQFVQYLRNNLENGLLRNVTKDKILNVSPGFQTFGPDQVGIPTKLIVCNNGLQELSDFRPTGATDKLVYGRTIQYDEGCFAEVRISFSPKFAKMIVQIMKINEPKLNHDGESQHYSAIDDSKLEITQIVMLDQPQNAFRYFQNTLETLPLILTVEQINSQNPNLTRDRAIRVSVTKIISEKESETKLDFVIMDPQILDQNSGSLKLHFAKKVLIENIYRDALACISKMEDISHEYVRCIADTGTQDGAIVRIEEPPPAEIAWKIVYRKVIPNKELGTNYVMNCLSGQAKHIIAAEKAVDQERRHEPFNNLTVGDAAKEELKVVAFETTSKSEEVFVFKLKDIFTHDELHTYCKHPHQRGSLFQTACGSRLKIRELDGEDQMYSTNQNEQQMGGKKPEVSKHRFTIYFIDPIVSVVGFDEDAFDGEESNNARKLLKKQFSLFDIKQGFHLPLIQNLPEMMRQTPKRHEIAGQDAQISMNPRTTAKSLICQLERDDLMFDVYQMHITGGELTLQINIFNGTTFRQICSATVTQKELKVELETDRQTHLLEGHNKERLAKYLVENTYYDERRDLVYFLRSPETMAPNHEAKLEEKEAAEALNAQVKSNDAPLEEHCGQTAQNESNNNQPKTEDI